MRTRLVVAVLALFSVGAHAQFDLGRILDTTKKVMKAAESAQTATKEFSQEEEIQLGEGISAGLLGAMTLHPDERMQRYVNRVGRWIALQSERADLPWSFGVLQSDSINAFAMPGGTIMVSHGLVKRLNSESELAGVLAHEIAHVVKKHQLAAVQSGAGSEAIFGIGKEVAAEAIGRRGGGALAAQGKTMLAQAGLDLLKNGAFLRPLDRSMEYEADRVGVILATRAGYDPYGLVAVLQLLQSLKPEDSGISIFTTHPQPSERIAELEKIVPTVLEQYAAQPQLEGRFRQSVGAR